MSVGMDVGANVAVGRSGVALAVGSTIVMPFEYPESEDAAGAVTVRGSTTVWIACVEVLAGVWETKLWQPEARRAINTRRAKNRFIPTIILLHATCNINRLLHRRPDVPLCILQIDGINPID